MESKDPEQDLVEHVAWFVMKELRTVFPCPVCGAGVYSRDGRLMGPHYRARADVRLCPGSFKPL